MAAEASVPAGAVGAAGGACAGQGLVEGADAVEGGLGLLGALAERCRAAFHEALRLGGDGVVQLGATVGVGEKVGGALGLAEPLVQGVEGVVGDGVGGVAVVVGRGRDGRLRLGPDTEDRPRVHGRGLERAAVGVQVALGALGAALAGGAVGHRWSSLGVVVGCPGRESNPHWPVFKTGASAG